MNEVEKKKVLYDGDGWMDREEVSGTDFWVGKVARRGK